MTKRCEASSTLCRVPEDGSRAVDAAATTAALCDVDAGLALYVALLELLFKWSLPACTAVL